MNALRKESPDSVAQLFDAYGKQLFQYCWLTVRSGDAAVAATRDTVIAARAHIGRLRDPEMLTPWLYALARVQCQYRIALSRDVAAVPPAWTGQSGGDARKIAWHAVMSLSAAEREALDLVARHGMSARDVGLVTGLGAVETDSLIGQAQASLQRALTAELAFDRAPSDRPVPDRLTPRRVVSVAKVYALLPSLTLPPTIRGEVLAFARDPERENERSLAASRVAAFDHAGFPAPPELAVSSLLNPLFAPGIPDGSTAHRRLRRRSRRLAVGLFAAGALATTAFALCVSGLSLPSGTTNAYPAAAPNAISASGEAPSSVSAGPTLTTPNSRQPGRRTARVSRDLPLSPGQGVNAEMLYFATSRPTFPDRGSGPVSGSGNDSAPSRPGPTSSRREPAGPGTPPSQSTPPPTQPTPPPTQPTTPAPTTSTSTPPTVSPPTQSPTPTSDPSESVTPPA